MLTVCICDTLDRMDPLEILVVYLRSELESHDPHAPAVAKWLTRVSATEPDSIQLAACLGIDLLTGAVEAALVAGLISTAESASVPHYCSAATWLFQYSLTIYPHETLLCGAKQTPGTVQYVRVLDFASFVKYFASDRPLTPETLAAARRQFPSGAPLGGIRKEWRGGLSNVWVTTEESLSEVVRNAGALGPGTAVNIRFGFGMSEDLLNCRPSFVAVRYPMAVPKPCVKPRVFDQIWSRPHLYVSSGTDKGWGRTLAACADQDGIPERVHRRIDSGLTDEFTIHEIGPSDADVSVRTDVAEASLERFVEVYQLR